MHDILADEPALNEFVFDKFSQHLGRDEKQRASFESHITTALDPGTMPLSMSQRARAIFASPICAASHLHC